MTEGREIRISGEEQMRIFKATNIEKPKSEHVKLMKQMLDDDPALWQDIGNVARNIEGKILDMHFSGSALLKESYRRKLGAMRDSLGWEHSTEMERILIEQVCLNWLRHNFMESAHAEKTKASHTIEVGIYWDKILSGSQKRYLRACESLAKVRKLLAEANFRDAQAQKKRTQGAAIAGKLLKDITTGVVEDDD